MSLFCPVLDSYFVRLDAYFDEYVVAPDLVDTLHAVYARAECTSAEMKFVRARVLHCLDVGIRLLGPRALPVHVVPLSCTTEELVPAMQNVLRVVLAEISRREELLLLQRTETEMAGDMRSETRRRLDRVMVSEANVRYLRSMVEEAVRFFVEGQAPTASAAAIGEDFFWLMRDKGSDELLAQAEELVKL